VYVPSEDIYFNQFIPGLSVIQNFVIKFVTDFRVLLYLSSTNKTDRHDMTKILLTMALSTITLIHIKQIIYDHVNLYYNIKYMI